MEVAEYYWSIAAAAFHDPGDTCPTHFLSDSSHSSLISLTFLSHFSLTLTFLLFFLLSLFAQTFLKVLVRYVSRPSQLSDVPAQRGGQDLLENQRHDRAVKYTSNPTQRAVACDSVILAPFSDRLHAIPASGISAILRLSIGSSMRSVVS